MLLHPSPISPFILFPGGKDMLADGLIIPDNVTASWPGFSNLLSFSNVLIRFIFLDDRSSWTSFLLGYELQKTLCILASALNELTKAVAKSFARPSLIRRGNLVIPLVTGRL